MENKTKADSKTVKEKAKTDLLVCVFGCFAGNGAVHGRQEGEEGRKPLRTSPRLLDFAAAREPTRRQLRWRVEPTRPRSSCSSRGALQFLDILGTCFCNFYMFEYVFKYLLNVCSLCYVVNIVPEKHSKKVMCKCVFAFLFMLLNYKIQKKTKKNK
jgi:hypothetical protein